MRNSTRSNVLSEWISFIRANEIHQLRTFPRAGCFGGGSIY